MPTLGAIPGAVLLLMMASCVSSEESGSGRASNPQPAAPSVRIPTTEQAASSEADAKPPAKARQRGGLTSRQDTVQAAVVRRTGTAARSHRPIKRPAQPMYTVQIGAFARAANALRFEKQARGRYPDLPVSNRFDKSDRLYRVSVGVFGTKREASALRRSMREQYPKEYHDAWVIYTSR